MSDPEQESEESEEELQLEQPNEENDLGLSLETNEEEEEEYDEEAERNKYGLNSPKGKNGENRTPNTRFRDEANINSPKIEKTMNWSQANKKETNETKSNNNTSKSSGGGGVESLVTQVDRPTTTQPEEDSMTEDNLKTESSGGFCSCFCKIFSCCSPSVQVSTENHVTNHEKNYSNNNTTSVPNTTRDESQSEDEEYDEPSGLLPPMIPEHRGRKCLVLDLDETLVHSSFKPISTADFIIPVEIDSVVHRVYVMKRPFVDEFLVECAKHYEIVIFTASLAKYADPLLDELDKQNTISHRLFRESCVLHGTAYVKDLRKLGRRLKDTIIVDNSAQSYLFQPKNAVPILSWFDDRSDTQLRDFIPVLETTLKNIKDVRNVLDANNKTFKWLCNQANQPLTKYE